MSNRTQRINFRSTQDTKDLVDKLKQLGGFWNGMSEADVVEAAIYNLAKDCKIITEEEQKKWPTQSIFNRLERMIPKKVSV